jgi:hypothetical protein
MRLVQRFVNQPQFVPDQPWQQKLFFDPVSSCLPNSTGDSRDAGIGKASSLPIPSHLSRSSPTGIRYLAFRRLRVYTGLSQTEPFLHFPLRDWSGRLCSAFRKACLHSSPAPSVFQTPPSPGGFSSISYYPGVWATPCGPAAARSHAAWPRTAAACRRGDALRQEQPIIARIPQSATSRPPVFTSLCCKLVKDQLPILPGSARRRQRLLRL